MIDDRDPGPSDPTVPDTGATEPVVSHPRARHLSGYELGDVLGRGGMGEVIAATDLRIEREVALKRMRGDASPDAVTRFLREARIQARLDHPAIVPVHEVGSDGDGRPYFTMKRLAGTTLLAKLQERGTIQPLLRALVDVGFAVGLAHERGIVHRDLKPANIMLGDYNEVYVLDWGIARVLEDDRRSSASIDGETKPGMTAAGAMLGTPGYMAPEQMRGDPVGPAADVYSLGVILFEILAGKALHPPGQGAIASTLAHPTESPARRHPDAAVAPELDALCVEALAEEASARPSARSLAERIQRYLDGDRDLEGRRQIAQAELAIARAALDSRDPARRPVAAQSAARALAFDPTSHEAADLVTRMLLEPSPVDPPELVSSLRAEDARISAERSRRTAYVFLSIYLFVPFLFFGHVESWTALIMLYGVATAMAVNAAINARSGKNSLPVLMVGNFVLAVAFSRFESSFVLTPMLICGQLMSVTMHRSLDKRPWIAVAWGLAAFYLPLLLESVGVLGETWRFDSPNLVTHGVIGRGGGNVELILLLFAQGGLTIVITLYLAAFSRATRDAQRRVHRQVWHLQQMIPRATGRLR